MGSQNVTFENLILYLHNQATEMTETFDQTLTTLEIQKTENETEYQKQLKHIQEEQRKLDQETEATDKLIASASSTIKLNVGGKKMTVARSTLTLIKGTVLDTLFSGKWDYKLPTDADGDIFLDYDPILFEYVLTHLDNWSKPTVKRLFRTPTGYETIFIDFVHGLNFHERYIYGTKSIIAINIDVIESEQKDQPNFHDETHTATSDTHVIETGEEIERFQTEKNSDIRLTNLNRRCEKINMKNDWQCVFGTFKYSTDIHPIRPKVEKGISDIFIGICSENKLPNGPYFFDQPAVYGWLTDGTVIENGQKSQTTWSPVDENDSLEIIINCDGPCLSIHNERSRAVHGMMIDNDEVFFPWSLLIVLHHQGSRVALV